MIYNSFIYFAITAVVFSAENLQIKDIKEADAHRQKTIQKLHVAQAPVHSKQDKASAEEISSYATAVTDAVAFQRWVASNRRCAIILKTTSNAANDQINRRDYSIHLWAIHDADIKTTPPFTRKDIGVAIKMMNDVRALFMLPVMVDTFNSMPERQ